MSNDAKSKLQVYGMRKRRQSQLDPVFDLRLTTKVVVDYIQASLVRGLNSFQRSEMNISISRESNTTITMDV